MNDLSHEIYKVTDENHIDPMGFDITMSALLLGLGADKYIDIFRKHNIGQHTLIELSDEDLNKLGIDDSKIREKLIEELKNLPIYEEKLPILSPNLNLIEITDVLEESNQHLYRICLSMMTNSLALKKKKIEDCLINKDKYASNIAIATLSSMTNILNSVDIALHTQIKISRNKKTKKILVGTLGSALATVIAIFFIRSLKDIQ